MENGVFSSRTGLLPRCLEIKLNLALAAGGGASVADFALSHEKSAGET